MFRNNKSSPVYAYSHTNEKQDKKKLKKQK